MARKTLKMLAVALVAAFALSSVAEAGAPPKKSVRHRTKHSSRVASGASTTTARKPAPKKPAPSSRTRSQASRSTTSAAAAPPATKAPVARRQSTKPH